MLVFIALVDVKKVEMNSKFIAKAEKELGETEIRKSQALVEIREWISKHHSYKNCRQGEFKTCKIARNR